MMKRRHFWRYVLAGSAYFGGIVGKGWTSTTAALSPPTQSIYKWVVLYWMPYDNDLVYFSESIISMLINGTQDSEEILVAIQSDYRGDSNMRRRQFINGMVSESNIASEDSSDVYALVDYLDWASRTFVAEHWAVIIMGHGGQINEISLDNHQSTSQPQTWMRVDHFTDAVRDFNHTINSRVELLFFCNCNKATLEVIYQAKNCARYTLASQLLLGAPSYYYEGFLQALKACSDGREAALAIMNVERPHMYHTLTLVDNQAVDIIPEKSSQLLQTILKSQLPIVSQLDLPTYRYLGEQHCDLLAFLGALSKLSAQGHAEFVEFADFLRSSVIVSHKTGGELYGNDRIRNIIFRNMRYLNELCGLSLYLPTDKQAITRYSSLALYQNIDLLSLYEAIVT